ncbi:MAG: PHP domain-containing protein [Acidobacteria bacterium]|nr:PHP domain-containing protein [Acidobacteriota bacterium]
MIMKSLLALCLAVLSSATAQVPLTQKPDITLHGSVTRADYETYKELPFTVPAGVTRISVEYTYDRSQHTVIDIGLLDPQRFRGWAGGAKTFFTVSESDTTPAFLSGPIVPGTWKILFGIPNIRANTTTNYEVKIWFGHEGDVATVSTFSREPLRKGPAWYRGDLHLHDAHSDGKCPNQDGEKVPCPLYNLVLGAVDRGLDFIAITDHNTTSHFSDMRELQPYFSHLLLIPGREITTFYGHANVWGTTDPIDFRIQHDTATKDFVRILDRVDALHATISINHPAHPYGEICMGCGWTVPNTPWERIHVLEAINGDDPTKPYSSIPLWESKLNEGHRIAAIGGSDNHTGTEHEKTGYPTTVVYAQNLSERAILDGIRAGHDFIDAEGSKTRAIEWTAQAGKQTYMMGDALASPAGAKLTFTLATRALNGAHPELIIDGKESQEFDASDFKGDVSRTFHYTSDGKRHWLRINIRDTNNKLLILSNPIYLNF